MQNDVIKQIKDKLQCDLEQCIKDKGDLKKEGLFSKSDVILGRETEIRELLEFIEELEQPFIKEEIEEVKSLRWLANNFPYNDNPQDNTDRLTNAIHIYCTAGANMIEKLAYVLNKKDNCGRDYVKQTGKCPMCIDCPHNCPLDNKN